MQDSGRPRRVDGTAFDWRPLVERVCAESAAVDARSPLNEAAELELAHRGLQDAALYVVDHGFALVRDATVVLSVAPAWRRLGYGERLLGAALADHVDVPLQAWAHGGHPGAAVLAARHGFTAIRELWLMRRPPSPVAVVPPPEGTRIRPFVAGEDEDAFLAANAAAFATHPEQGRLTLRGLQERMAQPWFDAAGLLLAERAGRVVGFHWTKVHADADAAVPPGEVYVIGVVPEAQGSGLARPLLTAGLARLGAEREVLLYVEADNTAAIDLYLSAGFTHAPSDTDIHYARLP